MRGASKGEGLGNQFLANIREVDAVAHVLRCFEDGDITHVENRIDPVADAETVETELMLADLDSLERRVTPLRKRAANDKEAKHQVELMDAALAYCCARASRPASSRFPTRTARAFDALNLLTSKPVLYVCNVEEASAATGNAYSKRVEEMAAREGAGCVVISAAIESEIAQLALRRNRRNSSRRWASKSPASTVSSGPAMRCSA